MPTPPETRREVVTETRHGTEVADPYRWLEGDGEAVREWTAAQNEYAEARLDSPTRDRLRGRMADLADVAEYGPVKPAGGRYFQTVAGPDDDRARLVVRESPDAEGRVLADPNEWPANRDAGDDDAPPRSMRWFLPSPDGERVAYGVTEGGDEQVAIVVASVPDGERVAVRENCGRAFLAVVGFDAVSPGMVAWDADGEGLYYVATGSAADGSQTEAELRRWRFDRGEETLLEHDEPQVWPVVRSHPASGTLAVGFHDVSGTDWSVLVGGEPRPVIEDSDAETFVVFGEETVYLQTDREAPNRRVVACSLAAFRAGDLSLAECETVLPEREAVLQSFAVTADHLVAHYQEDAHSRLAVYDRRGEHVRDLPLPDYVTVSGLRSDDAAAKDAEPESVFYAVEGFDRPPAVVRARPATGERAELASVEVGGEIEFRADDLTVRQTFVESSGGAEVPVFVCHREGVELDGDNPAVLSGYGGFRKSVTPEFDRFRLPFLADGGVYAQVCARGGGEYGESWHEAGMLSNKPRTFDDFAAAGEYLCREGYTNPDRLAVVGRSNGGLSVGGAVVRRPDLWAAARCGAPLLDMLRFDRFLLGESWTSEYGDPADPEAFDYLRRYSPYHDVEPGVEYPAVLFTTGADDARVHPAHARKMAARLQNEAEGGPFLLRTRADAGHGTGKSVGESAAAEAEEWAFLYEQLGLGE